MPNSGDSASPLQQRSQAITQALRDWDPDAEVQADPANGRLSILTTLPSERVMSILAELGEHAEPLSEDTGHGAGGTCCGGCSH